MERARSAGLGRTQASSRASYGKRGLPDGASVRGARVGREARGNAAEVLAERLRYASGDDLLDLLDDEVLMHLLPQELPAIDLARA